MINKLTFGSHFKLTKPLTPEDGGELITELGIAMDGKPTKECPFEIGASSASGDASAFQKAALGIDSVTSILDKKDIAVRTAIGNRARADMMSADDLIESEQSSIDYYEGQFPTRELAQAYIDRFK